MHSHCLKYFIAIKYKLVSIKPMKAHSCSHTLRNLMPGLCTVTAWNISLLSNTSYYFFYLNWTKFILITKNKNNNNFKVVIIIVTIIHGEKSETCCTMNYCLHNDVFDDLWCVGYIWSNFSLRLFFFLMMVQLQKLTSFSPVAAILTVQVL